MAQCSAQRVDHQGVVLELGEAGDGDGADDAHALDGEGEGAPVSGELRLGDVDTFSSLRPASRQSWPTCRELLWNRLTVRERNGAGACAATAYQVGTLSPVTAS